MKRGSCLLNNLSLYFDLRLRLNLSSFTLFQRLYLWRFNLLLLNLWYLLLSIGTHECLLEIVHHRRIWLEHLHHHLHHLLLLQLLLLLLRNTGNHLRWHSLLLVLWHLLLLLRCCHELGVLREGLLLHSQHVRLHLQLLLLLLLLLSWVLESLHLLEKLLLKKVSD